MEMIHGHDREHLVESFPVLGVVGIVGAFAAILLMVLVLGIVTIQ